MPDPSVILYTCVWCRDILKPEDTDHTMDPETGKVYRQHRLACASGGMADTAVSKAAEVTPRESSTLSSRTI